MLASIHKERCTALYGVPTMFIAELNHPMFDMFDMSSLRTGIMAGSLCPIELMRQVNQKCLWMLPVLWFDGNFPGMTQTRILTILLRFVVQLWVEIMSFTEVVVIDPETGELCPDGVQGELCCRGYNVMKGYYKNPKLRLKLLIKWLFAFAI